MPPGKHHHPMAEGKRNAVLDQYVAKRLAKQELK